MTDCRETALRDAAAYFRTEMARAWGGNASWLTTGTKVADLVADVLNELADDLPTAHRDEDKR